jgi:hypothetical protein
MAAAQLINTPDIDVKAESVVMFAEFNSKR